MTRLARVVVPGIPHHVTQRGNRRLDTFLCDGDYEFYIALMADHCRDNGVDVWAYCLMPNHVHLVLAPEDADGLRRTLAGAHRQYARMVNDREGWRGHLWQERFHSFPMDEAHLLMAVRYIELNPVRAGLTRRASEWRWSSARARCANSCRIGGRIFAMASTTRLSIPSTATNAPAALSAMGSSLRPWKKSSVAS